MKWNPFLEEEFISAIAKCNNSLAPRSDKLLWKHLKKCIKDDGYLKKIIAIANMYIKIGYWPSHFKVSMVIVISKPNKELYDTLKAF